MLEKIGTGSSSTVYRAIRLEDNQKIALKVLVVDMMHENKKVN